MGENGIITRTINSRTIEELVTYKEELALFHIYKSMENIDFNIGTLNAGKNSLVYNTQPEDQMGQGNIKTIISNISDEYIDKIEIIKGKIVINTKDKNLIDIALSIGINVNPYDIVDGELLSSNGNLLLVDEEGTLTIPDSVTKIGEGAFANLEGLRTIIIPGTCKEIAANAFSYNTTLEKVIMQDGVEKIRSSAFASCSNLKVVQMTNSIKIMEGQAFLYCSKLENINISSNLTALENNVFNGCTSLTNIILPEGINALKPSCLGGTSITEINIPSTVNNIDTNAFINCSKLININMVNNNSYFFSDGILSTKKGDKIIFIVSSKLKDRDVFNIPEGVTSFNYALQNYTNIKKIVIPSTLKTLTLSQGVLLPKTLEEIEVTNGNETFISEDGILYTKNDNKLICCFSKEKDIVIKEGITSFGVVAFNTATNAKKITLPNTVTTIGYMTFTSGPLLEEVIIGSNVTTIDPMFKYLNRSGTVTISEDNPNYLVENNILYTKDKKQIVTILNAISGKFIIPSGVEKIQRQAFHAQSLLNEIIISDTVKEIEASFGYCKGLKSITIPASVEKIGNNCFQNCNNLNEIIIEKPKDSIAGAPWGATKGAKVVIWNN